MAYDSSYTCQNLEEDFGCDCSGCSKCVDEDPIASGPPYFAQLRVVQSTQDWCQAPCHKPSWELAAPKSTPGSNFALYEAAIWRQNRRVVLYRFDKKWMAKAQNVYHEICKGTWSCPEYEAFREEKALLSFGPWSQEVDWNKAKLSTYLSDKFEQFFQLIRKEGSEHTGLSYSGHGARADGSLFQGLVMKQDAQALLQSVTSALPGARLAFLNFGTNCAEGRWNMLAAMRPYADWILASDLDVGGIHRGKGSPQQIDAQQELQASAVLQRVMLDRVSIPDAVKAIVNARGQLWNEVLKADIDAQETAQTLGAFDTSHVAPFQHHLIESYTSLPEAQRRPFEQHIEDHQCDILEAARFLDAQKSSSSFLQKGKLNGTFLQADFESMRPYFASTAYATTGGLGFNFAGYHRPPCDIGAAMGDAPPPPGGWKATPFLGQR